MRNEEVAEWRWGVGDAWECARWPSCVVTGRMAMWLLSKSPPPPPHDVPGESTTAKADEAEKADADGDACASAMEPVERGDAAGS